MADCLEPKCYRTYVYELFYYFGPSNTPVSPYVSFLLGHPVLYDTNISMRNKVM